MDQTNPPEKALSFRALPPPEWIKTYRTEHPQAAWTDYLILLTTKYPQLDENQQAKYLIHGGAAVALLNPHRRAPRDIDIIIFDETVDRNFRPNASPFDPKLADIWLSEQSLSPAEETIALLRQQTTPITVNGQIVYILSPAFLAASKRTGTTGRSPSPRPEDEHDVRLLNITEVAIQEALRALRGNP